MTSTYTSLSIDKSFPNLTGMEKVDDYTVKFTFGEPITTLDALLGDYGSPMISPNCFDPETGEITSTVIGTGRYIVDEHVQDQYATFKRNDNYWGENRANWPAIGWTLLRTPRLAILRWYPGRLWV